MCVLSHFSRVQIFVILWTAALQAPLSMGFSREEYWSGLPCPPPGDLPDPGSEPVPLMSLASAGGFFTSSTTWWSTHWPISFVWCTSGNSESLNRSPRTFNHSFLWDSSLTEVCISIDLPGIRAEIWFSLTFCLSSQNVGAQSLQSCLTLCNPMDCRLSRLCPQNSPGKNTGMGCHALSRVIFLTQGLTPHVLCLLHGRQILYCWATRESQVLRISKCYSKFRKVTFL